MPTVIVAREDLYRDLGVNMTDHEFADLCFEFGLELDDITSEKEIVRREKGEEAAQGLDETVLYKIEVAANRYDLLCLEGLTQALKVFLNLQAPPQYRIHPNVATEIAIIDESTQSVRPFFVCAILRNLHFNPTSYKSFIELQDKLHQNIGRKRTLVAIGTHDYDTIRGPFTYTAKPASEIKFKALKQTEEYTAEQLFEIYRKDNLMKKHVQIVENSPVIPIIYDSQGTVLSMPPIINSDHSKITLNTKNVFIDITANDLTKAHITLHTIIAAFSQYCDDMFTVEPVKVIDPQGREHVTPRMNERDVQVDVGYINRIIGTKLSSVEICKLLNKMSLTSQEESESKVKVRVPITRSDILHPCDIAEDVGIAFGYNNIEKRLPKTITIAKQQPLNLLTDLLRAEIAQAGFIEIMTFALISFDENYDKLRRERDNLAVEISNPKTLDFQMPRTTLLPGLLRTLASNKKHPLPIKIFELSDVVVKDGSNENKARNIRTLSALSSSTTAGFEVVHGLLDTVMEKLGFIFPADYHLEQCDNPTFFPGRQAHIISHGKNVGTMGIVHPEVVKNFELKYPVSALEIDIELVSSLIRI